MTPRPAHLRTLRRVARRATAALLAAALVLASTLVGPDRAAAAPAITSVSPAGGPVTGGTIVTITGSGFVDPPAVTFGGTPAASVTFIDAATLTVTVPAHAAGAVDVVVTNPDTTAATRTNGYTYQTPPTVAAVAPATGAAAGGTSVTITGTGFTGATAVTFGGTAALSFSVTNATTITATTPPRPAAGAVDVAVTNFAGVGSLVNGYIYTSSPTIAFITPTSGPITGGTSVTITGAGFVTGATVMFGGIPSGSVSVASGTQVTAVTPPAAAGAVDIAVRNPDGQTVTLSGGFTYQAGPSITKVSPGIGPLVGGTVVTIEGNGYQPGATVTMGGVAASITSASASKITAISPAHAAGAVSVVVVNPDGLAATAVNAFVYSAAPTVTAAAPANGPVEGGTAITITGTGFAAGATVTVAGTAATSVVVVGPNTITAVTPKYAKNGKVDVVVKNPDGLDGTGVALFTYEGAPEPTPTAGAGGATTCTATPGGGKYTKGRQNFVLVQGCTDVPAVVTLMEKKRGGKVASLWHYDPAADAWTFYLPPAGVGKTPLGSLTRVPSSMEILIVVLR